MNKAIRILGIALAGALALTAAKGNWTATVTQTAQGAHVLGNPEAKVKLTEYVSYTCPHCSTFQQNSEAPMRLAYVMPGKVSVEVVNFVRDPVDLTAAMLTTCGDPKGFFKRHHDFLYAQDRWLTRMAATSEAQRKRWYAGDIPSRLRAIASDFDFYEMMAKYGLTRAQVDRCLADTDRAEQLVAQTAAAQEEGVRGTPSFALDDVLLAGTHDWATLNPQIEARLD